MGIIANGTEKSTPDHFQPSVINAFMSKNLFTFSSRPLPLIVSSEHVENRFVERASGGLKYDSEHFQWTTATSLLFAKAQARIMNENSKDRIRTLMPTPDGMYLGFADKCNEESFYHPKYILSSKGNRDNPPVLQGAGKTAGMIMGTKDSPKSFSNFLTFVSLSDLGEEQATLRKELQKILLSSGIEHTMTALFKSYATGIPMKTNQEGETSRIVDKLHKIMQGDLWQKVNKKADLFDERHRFDLI